MRDDGVIGKPEALNRAAKLLMQAEVAANDRNAAGNAKEIAVNYRVKIAYAWMELAERLK